MPEFIHQACCMRSLTWVRERVGYSAEAICDVFHVDYADKAALLAKLMAHRIIRRKSSASASDDAEPMELYFGGAEYAFCYVGIYVYRGHMVYILPKYADTFLLHRPDSVTNVEHEGERYRVFELVLKAIQRYHSRNAESLEHAEQENLVRNDLALFVTIVTDFFEHGEYRDERAVDKINESGRAMWAHTINKKYALIQQNSSVYADIITRRRVWANDNPITLLHRRVVHECCRSLSQLGILQLLSLPEYLFADDDCFENETTESLLYLVESELQQQFDSRRRHVLELLRSFLSCLSSEDREAEPEYAFGCSSFNMVWEDACKTVLGNDISASLKIKSPMWHMENQTLEAPSCLIPDMVFTYPDKTCVGDAKYYVPLPCLNGGLPAGLPGVGDISKQFLYQQALLNPSCIELRKHLITKPVYNAFFMPMPLSCAGNPVKHYGTITMPLFPSLRIETLQISPAALFVCYAEHENPSPLREQVSAFFK